MFAVIFRATLANPDEEYYATARRLRQKAMEHYRCADFTSVQEGDQEIAISYWHNRQDIDRWKQDPDHQAAREAGRTTWYRNWQVEIVEIKHSYTGRHQ